MKKPYAAPELKVHGDIREVTKGGSSGRRLDASFSIGTEYGDLTFS